MCMCALYVCACMLFVCIYVCMRIYIHENMAGKRGSRVRSSVREAMDDAKVAAQDWMDAMNRREKAEKNKASKGFMVRHI
jgi:hypothetical protein